MLQFEYELIRLRRHLADRADGSDLVAAADLDGDAAQGQIDDALAGDVAVLVVAVDELGIQIFEPVRIHLAVMPPRRQVFPRRAVQMQPHRDRLSRLLVDHAQAHGPIPRRDRFDPERWLLDSGRIAIRQVHGQLRIRSVRDGEPSRGMRRVLDDDRGCGGRWLHVGGPALPCCGVVIERGAGGNNRAQVDGNDRIAAVGFELAERVERRPLRQGQPQFAAHARPQRMLLQSRGRDAVDDRPLLSGAQDDRAERRLRFGIRQRVEPEVFQIDGSPRVVPRFAPAPRLSRPALQVVVITAGGEDGRPASRNRREWAGAPGDVALLNGEAAQDRGDEFVAVGVDQNVIGNMIAQCVAGVAPRQRRRPDGFEARPVQAPRWSSTACRKTRKLARIGSRSMRTSFACAPPPHSTTFGRSGAPRSNGMP